MGFPRTAPPAPQLLPLLLLCGMCSWGLAQELACDSTGENCVGSNAADVLTHADPTHGTPNAGELDNPGVGLLGYGGCWDMGTATTS